MAGGTPANPAAIAFSRQVADETLEVVAAVASARVVTPAEIVVAAHVVAAAEVISATEVVTAVVA